MGWRFDLLSAWFVVVSAASLMVCSMSQLKLHFRIHSLRRRQQDLFIVLSVVSRKRK